MQSSSHTTPFLWVSSDSLVPRELGLDYLPWFFRLSKVCSSVPVVPASFPDTPFYVPFTPGRVNTCFPSTFPLHLAPVLLLLLIPIPSLSQLFIVPIFPHPPYIALPSQRLPCSPQLGVFSAVVLLEMGLHL